MVKGIQRFARRAFRSHAATVARWPVAFIVAPLVIAAALCIGLTRLTIDSDPNLVWVPPDSEVNRQKQFFDDAFDPFFRVNQVILALDEAPASEVDAAARAAHAVHRNRWRRGGSARAGGVPAAATAAGVSAAVPPSSSSSDEVAIGGRGGQTSPAGDGGGDPAGILTQAYFAAVLNLTRALAGTPDSAGTVLDDICYKPIAGRGCLVESPLDYFRTDPVLIVSGGRRLRGQRRCASWGARCERGQSIISPPRCAVPLLPPTRAGHAERHDRAAGAGLQDHRQQRQHSVRLVHRRARHAGSNHGAFWSRACGGVAVVE
jgi:hypothetical protein